MAGAILLRPTGQASGGDRLVGIEPPTVRGGRPPAGVVGKAAASAGITAPRIAVRRGQRCRYVRAGAEAAIDQASRFQPLQRGGVKGGPMRLDDRLAVDGKAEPGQILENAVDELGAAAAGVEILDPKQESPAAGARMGMAQRRRKGMAQVQPAGRRGGETCDLQDSLRVKGDKGSS